MGLEKAQINKTYIFSQIFTQSGIGTIIDVSSDPLKHFSIQVSASGTVNAWFVALEASLDGINFTQALSHTNTSVLNNQIVFSGNAIIPCLYFRARVLNILTLNSGNITVTILGMR